MKTTVLMLAGTGFPDEPDGITADFLSRLDPDRFDTRVVHYPASFGGPMDSFHASRLAGQQEIYNHLNGLPDGAPVVLAGYSQGAVIAGDVARAWSLARTPAFRPQLKAVALIADGYRPEGRGLIPPSHEQVAPGYGIAGQRDITEVPAFWVSAYGDPIASLPAGNPLRTVADLSEWFTLDNPTDLTTWGVQMLNTVREHQLQDWWAPWKWSGWGGAAAFVRGYLFDGRHTTDYIKYGYTQILADQVNGLTV